MTHGTPSATAPSEAEYRVSLTRYAEQVALQRAQTIKSMFTTLQRAINELTAPASRFAGTSTGITHCAYADKHDASRCHPFQLGSLIQALAARGFYPLPSPAHYSKTIHTCRSELTKAAAGMATIMSLDGQSHVTCAPGISLAAKINSIPASFALTSTQCKRLAQQASMSGVSDVGPETSSPPQAASPATSTSVAQPDIAAFSSFTSNKRDSVLFSSRPAQPVTFRTPAQPVTSTLGSSPPAAPSVAYFSGANAQPANDTCASSTTTEPATRAFDYQTPSQRRRAFRTLFSTMPAQPTPSTLGSSTVAQPASSVFGSSTPAERVHPWASLMPSVSEQSAPSTHGPSTAVQPASNIFGSSTPAELVDARGKPMSSTPEQPAPNTLGFSAAAQSASSIFGPSTPTRSSSGGGTTPPGSP